MGSIWQINCIVRYAPFISKVFIIFIFYFYYYHYYSVFCLWPHIQHTSNIIDACLTKSIHVHMISLLKLHANIGQHCRIFQSKCHNLFHIISVSFTSISFLIPSQIYSKKSQTFIYSNSFKWCSFNYVIKIAHISQSLPSGSIKQYKQCGTIDKTIQDTTYKNYTTSDNPWSYSLRFLFRPRVILSTVWMRIKRCPRT